MKRVQRLAAMLPLLAILYGVGGAPLVRTVQAQDDIVVQPPCDEDAFDTAMDFIAERGGGTIVFNCGGAATIDFTSVKTIDLPTTIDGGGKITLSGGNSTRLFLVDTGDELTLRGLTLTRGFSPGDGGAIENNGTLHIESSTIRNSNAAGSGGAIVSYGPLTILDSTLEGNSAANAGAIYPRYADATTVLVDSNLRNNRATSPVDGWGGAILAWDGADVRIDGGTIAGNTARVGGGLHNRFANSTFTLTGVSVSGNRATANTLMNDVRGGGMFNSGGQANIYDSTFSGNDAAYVGGGLFNDGSASISNSLFTGNTALADGGGMSNGGDQTVVGALFSNNSSVDGSSVNNLGDIVIQNSTFSGNTVRGEAVFANYGTATIQNSTFSDNIDDTGQPGASTILQFSTQALTLKNVVLKTFVGGFGGVNCSASSSLPGDVPITSGGFNLSDDLSCNSYFAGAGDKNNTDPQLGPLADNGGQTMTHLPQPGSPLIDGGQCIVGVDADQRGVARPQGGACDIGAVEVQPEDREKQLFLPLVQQ